MSRTLKIKDDVGMGCEVDSPTFGSRDRVRYPAELLRLIYAP